MRGLTKPVRGVVSTEQQRWGSVVGMRHSEPSSSGDQLPQFDAVKVTVDPRINSGRPTIARRGVRVADVASRIAAGEPDDQVAADYDLSAEEVRSLVVSRS